MADETSKRLLNQLAAISADSLHQSVDWEARPDTAVSGSSDDGHVRIDLRGFDVAGVDIDGAWLESADRTAVETGVRQALRTVLDAMVDAEMERARATSYDAGDVQTQLLKLSQEAADSMNERIRGLGEGIR